MESTGSPQIAIRLATGADTAAVVRLAAVDSAPVPLGPVLVATLDGELVAARPLAGGRVFADPFRRTTQLLELLELRARQLPQVSPARRRYLPGILRRRAPRSECGAQAA